MKEHIIIKINFRGGIISPGQLFNILVAARKAGLKYVSFGLRQQLLIEVSRLQEQTLTKALQELGVMFECGNDSLPNVCSSYPAADVFIRNSWLSEGVYRDLFDAIDYHPAVKINVSDSNQSFTPMLTGNINWVASPDASHFWHLFIRLPKTNQIIEWDHCVYSNDLPAVSRLVEQWMLNTGQSAAGSSAWQELFATIIKEPFIISKAGKPFKLPPFNLPYYEGFNSYHDKYWLGIYRRDELFAVDFLQDLCRICLDTRVGQICSTPWKSLIIKNIEEKHRVYWNALLAKHHINVRHAANELNFQVEDNCRDGLALKQYLVKHLNEDDIRTFGIAIGIRTRRKSEVFSSILIRQRYLFTIFGYGFVPLYDLLCSHDFNPNERTAHVFSRNNFRWLLPEQLRRAILSYYAHQQPQTVLKVPAERPVLTLKSPAHSQYQCSHCLSVYDEVAGAPDRGVPPGTLWRTLADEFCCELCDAPKTAFVAMPGTAPATVV
ncbi:MAG: rubredoxin [Pedobacter sp.]|nr:MAG: rubredoxin [Pedobacter sp.]